MSKRDIFWRETEAPLPFCLASANGPVCNRLAIRDLFRDPMPTERTWQEWLERLYNLRRDKRGSQERPHKPVLLLSILDLLDCGQVKTNQTVGEKAKG